MNPILELKEIKVLIFCVVCAFAFHFLEKWLRKGKLESEKEFEKFIAENDSSKKFDYRLKRLNVTYSNVNHRKAWLVKWFWIIFGIAFFIFAIFSNRS
jgi:hypothetical protein